jgi:hypothetical protein
VAKSKNVIRFAVGTPERHGPAWIVWHSGPNDDLYAGTRTMSGEIKASLHASGDFRVALTTRHMESGRAIVEPGWLCARAVEAARTLDRRLVSVRDPAAGVVGQHEL